MPFYFRKSVKAGPFRFNFSTGGVGASVGVKGFRIGAGPRGHYVHAGRRGFYYRATIGRAGEPTRAALSVGQPPHLRTPSIKYLDGVEMVEVESNDVMEMRDEAFSELLDEINTKRQQASMAAVLSWPFIIIALFAAVIMGPPGLAIGVLALIGRIAGRWLDSYRRTCILFYDLDADAESRYTEVARCFDELSRCAGQWHIEAGGLVQDLTTWKRNAGATRIVKKKQTLLTYKLPLAITSNITPPALYVGKQVIFLMPDVALIDDGRSVGAVSYQQLSISWQDSNFIEDAVVPKDALVIGYTWKHPNKNGGPDRRFRDNRQIPICRYEAMHLHSASGINELLEFSRTGMAKPLADALRNLPQNTKFDCQTSIVAL